jgi:hypothetical protein
MIKEYRDVLESDLAVRTVLAEAPPNRELLHGAVGNVKLIHSTAGFELAGSCARSCNAHYAVRWFDGSAYYGQRYREDDEASARAHFARISLGEGAR